MRKPTRPSEVLPEHRIDAELAAAMEEVKLSRLALEKRKRGIVTPKHVHDGRRRLVSQEMQAHRDRAKAKRRKRAA